MDSSNTKNETFNCLPINVIELCISIFSIILYF